MGGEKGRSGRAEGGVGQVCILYFVFGSVYLGMICM